jgi:hypothetical protein
LAPPPKLNATDWMNLLEAVARAVGDLGWMSDRDKRIARSCILEFSRHAFTDLRPSSEPSRKAVQEACKDLVTWIESLPDASVAAFCWDLLKYKRNLTPEPVFWLVHSGRLSGAISYDNIRLAVSLADEGDSMYWWPEERWMFANWERDSQPYLALLSHSSYLVRAAASKALGRLFYNLTTKASGGCAPPPPEILGMIHAYEVKTAGVAGPFLDGADWSCAETDWQRFSSGMDIKAWFIETLRQSDRERYVPDIQSLEFYAHEFFSRDADAIREFLKMGRKDLAILTATQDQAAISALLPVLKEMAASNDEDVSTAIRHYLSSPSHHEGLQYLDPGEEIF